MSTDVLEARRRQGVTGAPSSRFVVKSPYQRVEVQWLVGSVHNHTVSSQYAPVSPTEAVRLAAEARFDFFFITDHDRRFGELPWSEEEWLAAETATRCRLFRGFEASFPEDHVNCLGVLPHELAGQPGQPGYLEQVVERGGVCFLNHPYKRHDDPQHMLDLAGSGLLSGLEVYSGGRLRKAHPEGTTAAVATRLWDALLARGKRLWALASADCHSYDPTNPDHLRNGYVVVNAASVDLADLLAALRAGRFYASSGLRVDGIEVTDTQYTVSAREAAEIRFLGNGGQCLAAHNAQTVSYEFTGAEGHVRCEVVGAERSHPAHPFPKTAWLQPVFVGQRSWRSPRKGFAVRSPILWSQPRPNGVVKEMPGSSSRLALNGGPKAVQTAPEDTFTWPIITEEDERACLDVLRAGNMSGTDVTVEFEKEFAEWHGMKHCLAHNTGTGALHAAMWACGVGIGDEIICQSITYWASALPVFGLGGTVVFADMGRDTLCLDPADIEHRITDRTKAIIAVHYCGYPSDMDPIMEIAARHGVKVIEDVSHAHGSLYKGRLCGTLGHVSAMSVMSGKALPVGEGGMLMTNDDAIMEKAMAFGHYERTSQLTLPELEEYKGVPWGGHKYRMHQLSSAVGRVQLAAYRDRLDGIQQAMNYFWDLLEGVPGIKPHRPARESGSTNGGWYAARGLYRSEEIGGLPIAKFCEAVRAEGVSTSSGANFMMHLHPLFNTADIYGHGKPTRIANADRDVRQPEGSLPVTEALPSEIYTIPWFKHYRPRIIEEHAEAFRKVAECADELHDR